MIYSYRSGQGKALVFLHGFCEDHRIWLKFTHDFFTDYRCVLPDLPGFGESSSSTDNLDDWARELWKHLDEHHITHPYLIGHSLGGYVALAMTEQRMADIGGLCLFHSSAFADTKEKMANRDKAKAHVAQFGTDAFVKQLIPSLYAKEQHPAISNSLSIAQSQSATGIQRALEAMKTRPDRSAVLKQIKAPVAIISGIHDALLPLDQQAELASYPDTCNFKTIEGVGHMGMYEAPDTCAQAIKAFVQL